MEVVISSSASKEPKLILTCQTSIIMMHWASNVVHLPQILELPGRMNEAYSVLSDITKRRRYDSDLTSGAHTSRHNEPHPGVTELEQKLSESKRKCTMLKKKLVSVQKDALPELEQKLAESVGYSQHSLVH